MNPNRYLNVPRQGSTIRSGSRLLRTHLRGIPYWGSARSMFRLLLEKNLVSDDGTCAHETMLVRGRVKTQEGDFFLHVVEHGPPESKEGWRLWLWAHSSRGESVHQDHRPSEISEENENRLERIELEQQIRYILLRKIAHPPQR